MAKIPKKVRKKLLTLKTVVGPAFKLKKLFVFGSYADGRQTPDSDIDVCLVCDQRDNSFKVLLKLMPEVMKIDSRLEPVVFSTREFNEKQSFGLLREIKEKGIEIL